MRITEAHAKWIEEHKDHIKKVYKKWVEKHKDYFSNKNKEKRAKKYAEELALYRSQGPIIGLSDFEKMYGRRQKSKLCQKH